MYNSVNLRVLSTIPTQLSSPLKCKCGIKVCNDRLCYTKRNEIYKKNPKYFVQN
nr:MAG TPA: hypothetical protein [Caudoviricetes sp.]